MYTYSILDIYVYLHVSRHVFLTKHTRFFWLQRIADRVAQHLEIYFYKLSIVYQAYQDSHRIDHLLLYTTRKSHGQNSGSMRKFLK